MAVPTHAEIDKIFDDYLEVIENLQSQFFEQLDQNPNLSETEKLRINSLFNANKNNSRDPANTMRVLWKGYIPNEA